MAAPQLQRKPIPYGAYGAMERDAGNARADGFEPDFTLKHLDFGATADPVAWRAIFVLMAAAIAAIGAIAGIAYFAGIIVAGIVATAVAALIGFGNWILNNTIDL